MCSPDFYCLLRIVILVGGVVKEASKRVRKYRDKLIKPAPGQVYHTVLKKIRFNAQQSFAVVPACLSTLEYVAYDYASKNSCGAVERGYLLRLVREAYSDYLSRKSVSSDTKRKCYKWFSRRDDYVSLCYNFWLLVEYVLSECAAIVCAESDIFFVDCTVVERIKLELNNITSAVEVIKER